MATRLYLSNTAPGYTPTTKRGTWTTSTSTVARLLGRRPSGATTTSAVAETSTTNNVTILLGRWISDPAVVAGTLAGTVQWVMGVLESSTNANDFFYLHAYVTTGDTDTPRGTILSNYTPGAGTEWPTTAAGATEGSVAITSQAVSVGDRICVEVGYQARNTSATSMTGTLRYGGTGTTDLANAATTVTTDPGWIEFSGADGIFNNAISSLVDDGSSGTIDTATKWTGSYGTYSNVAGRLRVGIEQTGGVPQYAALYTGDPGVGAPYRLANSAIFCEVPTVPALGGGTEVYCQLAVYGDVSGTQACLAYYPSSSQISCISNVAYSDASPTSVAYSATDHRWFRIRHDGTNVLWETSPDSQTWTTQRTLAAPSWTRYGDLSVSLEGARTTGTNDFVEFDNVNTPVLAVSAGAATATGAAFDGVAAFGANSDLAAGSGSAFDATVPTGTTAPADLAAGSGTAFAAAASCAAAADLATATGSAADAVAGSGASADLATGAGAAFDATVAIAVSPAADLASATGTAAAAFADIQVPAGLSAGTGTGSDAAPAVGAAAGLATAMGDALSAAVDVQATAGQGAATGAATDGIAGFGAPAAAAVGTGTAFDPTVSAGALAGAATGTGAADGAVVGDIFYVDPAGSDSNDGLSTGAAWATIGKVNATTLGPGDEVLFKRGGTWTGTTLTVTGSGQSGAPILLGAYGTGALPIIDGGGDGVTPGTVDCVHLDGDWITLDSITVRNASEFGILVSGDDVEVRNFTVTGCPFGVQQGPTATRTAIHDFTAVNNNVGIIRPGPDDDTGGMGVVLQGDLAEVYNFQISGNSFTSPDYGIDGAAVEIFNATNALIRDGYASDCRTFSELGGDGPGTDSITYRNIAYTNAATAADGIFVHGNDVYGPVTNVTIENCTFRLTGASSIGVSFDPDATGALVNSIVVANYAGYSSDPIDEQGNVFQGGNDFLSTHHATQSGISPTSTTADPLFVDAGTGNLRLSDGSPAINRGRAVAYSTDLDGLPRTAGGAPDSGAYEWQGPTAGVASGAGVAPDGSAAVAANAGLSAATGAGFDAAGQVGVPATLATASAAALDSVAAASPSAGSAAATATAADTSVGATAPADVAAATGTAIDATANTSSSVSAPADLGAATGVALDATTATTVTAGQASAAGGSSDAVAAAEANTDLATATGTAADAATTLDPNAQPATGAGTALDVTAEVTAATEVAEAAGSADDATVSTSAAGTANADVSAGIGIGYDATITVSVFLSTATAAVVGSDGAALLEALPGQASGSAMAFDATAFTSGGSVSASAEAAAAFGVAFGAADGGDVAIRQPGILTAGTTRPLLTAGTTRPRLTASTLRGPTFTSGG